MPTETEIKSFKTKQKKKFFNFRNPAAFYKAALQLSKHLACIPQKKKYHTGLEWHDGEYDDYPKCIFLGELFL